MQLCKPARGGGRVHGLAFAIESGLRSFPFGGEYLQPAWSFDSYIMPQMFPSVSPTQFFMTMEIIWAQTQHKLMVSGVFTLDLSGLHSPLFKRSPPYNNTLID